MSRFHPIALSIGAAIVLVIVGIYIVESRRPATPGPTGSWGSVQGYLDPVPSTPTTFSNELPIPDLAPDQSGVPQVQNPSPSVTQRMPEGASEDFRALLAEIASGITHFSPQASSTLSNLQDAFSFVPDITIPIPPIDTRTPEQETLYEYGNAIGVHIHAFALAYPRMVETLAAQVEDRGSLQKGSAVRSLGASYIRLGEEIAGVQSVPLGIQKAHETIVRAYADLGAALSKVPDATDDQSFIAAITTYNNTADAHISALISLSTMFSLKNVTFGPNDSGAMFNFRGN